MLALGLVAAAACGDDDDNDEDLTFYEPPTVLDEGEPGDLLDREPIELAGGLPATGERVTYVSTTPSNDAVPVTGVLLTPDAAEPAEGRPVAVWAHGTTGLGDDCAPSKRVPFSIEGVRPLLEAGYVVVAPDYEGLGVSGEIHPYLVGEAEGRNVLDAARLARVVGGNDHVVLWGHSQGGHAVLFARQLAPDYAPDLELHGVAAAAPVTNLVAFLLPGLTQEFHFAFLAEALLAWSRVYDELDLRDVVDVEDAERVRLARQACTADVTVHLGKPLEEVIRRDPVNEPRWQEAIRLNSVHATGGDVPVLLTHGTIDVVVPVSGTDELFDRYCELGVPTRYVRSDAWAHTGAYVLNAKSIMNWLQARVAEESPPDDCAA
jgi:alpha-beta hydrolase superfamily lysophospholipase